MTIKKKISIIISVIALLFALIALIISIIFVINASGVIEKQAESYNVSKPTVMWIADLGRPFFGSSIDLAIASITLSFIALFAIITTWAIILFRKKKKKIKFNGSKTVVAISSVTAIIGAAGIGVASYTTNDFRKNTDLDNVSAYFEKHAEKISNNRNDATNAGLLYVLANKNDLSAFSNASALQMSLATTIFYIIKKEITGKNSTVINELKEFSKNNPKLYKPVVGKFEGELIKGTKKQSAAELWINDFDLLSLLNKENKIKHGANILLNNDAYINLVSGNYPEIQKIIKKKIKNNDVNIEMSFFGFPPKVKDIFKEEGYYDDNGAVADDGVFEWVTKIGMESSKFEKRVLGTIAKLFKMPYTTKVDQVKSRITILEWLNTIINGVDYISKDETLELQNNFENIYGHTVSSTAETIYMPKTKDDGTFSIDEDKDRIVGKVGDNTYDIKMNMMKFILDDLQKEQGGVIETLLKRQKTITSDSFIKNILASKGLEKMTNQYATENYFVDKNNHYLKDKDIASIVEKIENFIQ